MSRRTRLVAAARAAVTAARSAWASSTHARAVPAQATEPAFVQTASGMWIPVGVDAPPDRRRFGGRGATRSEIVRNLTPARIADLLEQASTGDPRPFAELCHAVQDRNTHIVGVLGVRKRAVANLPWSLEPAGGDAAGPAERRIARDAETKIRSLPGLSTAFLRLLDAVWTGYAANEIEWALRGGQVWPVKLHYRPSHWLRPDPADPEMWRVSDPQNVVQGIPLAHRKWVVHVSQAKTGWPTEAGLARVVIWWYLFQTYALQDWASYGEKFGAPLRVGKYSSTAEPEDIDDLEDALDQLGVDAYAVIPDDMKVEFPADTGPKTGADTFERLLNFGNREISKVVLGGTLTVEGGVNGTQALGTVHNDVRADIRDADALELAETLTTQLVGPIVAWNWGERVPCPRFVFQTSPAPDLKADAEAQEVRGRVFQIARTLGVPVATAQVREELAIREPEAGEEILPPLQPAGAPLRGWLAKDLPARRWFARRRIPAAAVGETSALLGFDRTSAAYRSTVAKAWAELVDRMRAELGHVESHEQLVARVPAVLATLDLGPYADELASAMLASEALGRAQIRATSADGPVKLPTTSPLTDIDGWAAAARMAPGDWQARVVTTRASAEDTVRNTLLGTVKDLVAALEGESRIGVDATAQERADAALDAAQTSARHTDQVVDQAASARWAEGRWAGVVDRVGGGERLYLRYHTQGDNKVRPAHREMDGKVYPATHPIWAVWRPPNGYGCRCWITVHTAEEVRAAGWEVTEDYPELEGEPVVPDAGWQKHHGAEDYDWSAYPPSWKDALQVREARA